MIFFRSITAFVIALWVITASAGIYVDKVDHPKKVVVLKIDAERMHADGLVFFCSENGVWLTDHVPQQYIGGFP